MKTLRSLGLQKEVAEVNVKRNAEVVELLRDQVERRGGWRGSKKTLVGYSFPNKCDSCQFAYMSYSLHSCASQISNKANRLI